ncbi:hypothetical protein GF380_05270 [Candidatus Uhrbacteria bacterium]|nr:hypothetical protein [Candidatus Uhrbacteria bacterium]MBD3284442.1 hypothetical protein [Candidatus Uhrbacteria bacterium]
MFQQILTCAHCGSTYNTCKELRTGFGPIELGNGRSYNDPRRNDHIGPSQITLFFCGPICAMQYVREHSSDLPLEWLAFDQAFGPEEEWEYSPECAHCKNDERTGHFVPMRAPYWSSLDDEHDSMVCSVECILGLLQQESDFLAINESGPVGPWYNVP